MLRFVLQRCLQAIPTLLVISIVVFTLMRLAPGDPAVLRFGSQAALPENQPRIEALRHEMGLDQPIIVQYGIWLRDAAHGDFGTSLQATSRPRSSSRVRYPSPSSCSWERWSSPPWWPFRSASWPPSDAGRASIDSHLV